MDKDAVEPNNDFDKQGILYCIEIVDFFVSLKKNLESSYRKMKFMIRDLQMFLNLFLI